MVITFSSLKGGVGKSTNAILVATNLAARGKKVLFYDTDTNNSGTMYFTTGIENINELIEEKNVFESMSHHKLVGYTFPSRIPNVDICPSHLNIDMLRGYGQNELRKTFNTEHDYEYIIVDTAPHYDNILISALTASDLILTPIEFNYYNLTTTRHLESRFYDDCETKIDNWFLMYSRWIEQYAKFPNSLQSQYAKVFEDAYSNRILDVRIPQTSAAVNYTQTDKAISIHSSIKGEQRLATEINHLCNMILGVDGDEKYVEKF